MDIIVKHNNLQYYNINQLHQISIKEKCGQYILNMMVEHGIQQQMDGENGDGMDHNH